MIADIVLLRTMRIFYHSVRLPLCYYAQDICQYGLPRPLQDMAAMRPLGSKQAGAQYLQDNSGAHYVCLALGPDSWLSLGPLHLQDEWPAPVPGRGRLRGKTTPDGQGHLSEDSYFYLGKCMEELFAQLAAAPAAGADNGAPPPSPGAAQPDQAELYQHPPIFLEAELSRLISLGEGMKALSMLAEINRLMRARVARDPVRSLKNSLIGSCALFSRAAIAGGLSADAAFSLADAFIQLIEDTPDLAALALLEEEMVTRFSHQVAQRRMQGKSPVVREAMRYIDDHLGEKLGASAIAARIYVHKDYLSGIFRRESGVTLGAYIQKRRVQEAAHALRHSRLGLSTIAGRYGFCSQSHFTHAFKNLMGTTPMAWRTGSTPQGQADA